MCKFNEPKFRYNARDLAHSFNNIVTNEIIWKKVGIKEQKFAFFKLY